MKSLTAGTPVLILVGKHQGKSGLVKQVGEIRICCFVDNSFYFWFFPDSIKVCKPTKSTRRDEASGQMNLFEALENV